MFREKIQLLLLKIESVSGVDATPSPTVDAFRTVGIPTVVVSDLEDGNRDDVESGVMGAVDRAAAAGAFVRFDVTIELLGAGAPYSASVVPTADPFLRAGGLGKTLVATGGSESITYTTLDAGFETATAYAYAAGQLVKAVGCVFTPKLTFEVNKRVYLSGTVTGKLAVPVAAAAVPTHSFVSVIPPVMSGGTHSIATWTSAAADPLRILKAEIDLGTQISDLPGAGADDGIDGWTITDRRASLSMDIRTPDLATFNPYTLRRATGSALPLVVIDLGAPQYNNIKVATGRWQVTSPTRGNRNLVSTYSLAGRLQLGAAPTTSRELNITFN